ncbi:MAG: hypothetical protein K5695_17490 [Oscillospiraceae bacterium]|nr:hypothetical protein [Oscillospiraceae bacterium]
MKKELLKAITSAVAVSLLIAPISAAAAETATADPAGQQTAETEPTEQVTEPTEQATEPTEHVTEQSTEPAEQATEQATEPSEQATEQPTEQAVEPTEPEKPAVIRLRAGDQIKTDAKGNAYILDGEERRTGMFRLSPNFLMGDANRDETIDASDAALILTAAANAGALTESAETYIFSEAPDVYPDAAEALVFSDVNEDGQINASDAAGILVYSAASGAGADPLMPGTHTYYADENGYLQKGFFTDADGKKRYADDAHIVHFGRVPVGEKCYYIDLEEGLLPEGWHSVNEDLCLVQADGSLTCQTWAEYEGKQVYLDASGSIAHGLTAIGDAVYCFDTDGSKITGWTSVEDARYYFDENGTMQTGWVDTEQGRGYLGEDGIALIGWQDIGGKRYCFSEDGIMLTNQTVDGILLGRGGTEVSELLFKNQQRAQEAFDKYGTSIEGLYKYVRDTNRYKKTETTKTLEQIEQNGWLYYVDYAMTHRYGVCYYMAAKMDFMLQEAGYECRIVYSTHGTGDHYWNQVNVDGTWVNYDLTNNLYAKTWDQMVDYGSYRLIGYVTPVYQ